MRRPLFILLVSIACVSRAEAAPRAEAAAGEIIVRWKRAPGRLPAELGAVGLLTEEVAGHRVRGGRLLDHRTELLRLAPEATASALAALERRADVEYAEPNYRRRAMAKIRPNDEHYPLQWYLTAAQIDKAWSLATGLETTVVAVIDTGIRPHPDLEGRLLPGYDFIDNPVKAGDGDGRDGDPTDVGQNTIDSSGQHGTHIAGIIGAVANNQKGIAGVNWRAKILPVRVLGVDGGVGVDSDISAGIRWAAGLDVPGVPRNNTPAKVINLSFGSPGYGRTLSDAVGAAMQAGAVVVAAAGNDGVDAKDIFPAAVPGVITVAASDLEGRLAPYSNFGQVVDIVAPGGSLGVRLPFSHQGKEYNAGIISTMYDAETSEYVYHLTEGTSQAAPIVAGVVSLLVALAPDLHQKEAADALIGGANPAGRCAEGCGAGALDAFTSLTSFDPAGRPPGLPQDSYGVSCALDTERPTPPPLGLLLLLTILLARRTRRGQSTSARVTQIRRKRPTSSGARVAAPCRVSGTKKRPRWR